MRFLLRTAKRKREKQEWNNKKEEKKKEKRGWKDWRFSTTVSLMERCKMYTVGKYNYECRDKNSKKIAGLLLDLNKCRDPRVFDKPSRLLLLFLHRRKLLLLNCCIYLCFFQTMFNIYILYPIELNILNKSLKMYEINI